MKEQRPIQRPVQRGKIRTFFYWLGQFLFIDQIGGYLSHTKFWSNVGYLIWTGLFPYAVMVGSKASYDLWLVFGVVVIGNRTLARALEARKGGGPPGSDSRYSDYESDRRPDRYNRYDRYDRYDRPSRYDRYDDVGYDEYDGDSYSRAGRGRDADRAALKEKIAKAKQQGPTPPMPKDDELEN